MLNRLLIALIFVLAPCCFAQFHGTSRGNLKVRLYFPDGHPCNIRAHLRLMISASTTPVSEQFTNEDCMANFDGLDVGTYHLLVSGEGIEDTDSGSFEVDARKATQHLDLIIKRVGQESAGNVNPTGTPTVSVADLNIPEKAKKEFDKASGLIAQQNWKKALEQLNKALALYPNYVAAYNNLGVVYARLDDREREREALQKAVSLDAHFAPAYANLAKMAIVDHDYSQAEKYLNKANAADPSNSQTLVLLAQVELLNQHYDEAIENSRKAHSMSQDPHALAHYIAAHALEHENRLAEAVAELKTFLQEESTGARADVVRKEFANLQSQIR